MVEITGKFVLRTDALTGNLTIRAFELTASGGLIVKVTDHSGNVFYIDANLLEVVPV